MSKIVELTDEQYYTVERVAVARGQTPDAFLAELIEQLATEPESSRFYETEDWFRHLGATDEQIAVAEQIALTRTGAANGNT
jgi:hypothetical protein